MVEINKIESAIAQYNKNGDNNSFEKVCDLLFEFLQTGGQLEVAVDAKDLNEKHFDQEVVSAIEPSIGLISIQSKDGETFIMAYTSTNEVNKDKKREYSVVSDEAKTFFEAVNDIEDCDGIVLNPYGNCFVIDKILLEQFVEALSQC